MGTALCFCTFAVRQSCLFAPVALAGAPGGVASVAAAVAFEPRAPPALAAALDLLLAGCFCKIHQNASVPCQKKASKALQAQAVQMTVYLTMSLS